MNDLNLNKNSIFFSPLQVAISCIIGTFMISSLMMCYNTKLAYKYDKWFVLMLIIKITVYTYFIFSIKSYYEIFKFSIAISLFEYLASKEFFKLQNSDIKFVNWIIVIIINIIIIIINHIIFNMVSKI